MRAVGDDVDRSGPMPPRWRAPPSATGMKVDRDWLHDLLADAMDAARRLRPPRSARCDSLSSARNRGRTRYEQASAAAGVMTDRDKMLRALRKASFTAVDRLELVDIWIDFMTPEEAELFTEAVIASRRLYDAFTTRELS